MSARDRRPTARLANFAGWLMRTVGPWLPEHRIGRANLAAAFPEKSPAEIEPILRGVWDNLGRVGAEFAHLDRLWDCDPATRTAAASSISPEHRAIAIDSCATTASRRWSSPRISPTGSCRRSARAAYGLDSAVLYRRPNIGAIADAVIADRAPAAWAR